MTYVIIKNTPPTGLPYDKYPFNKMAVGDAFDFPMSDINRRKVTSAASSFGTRNGMKFCVRKLNETTLRCRRDA
jgi:hypothetical protein